jgi:hypothetical protein
LRVLSLVLALAASAADAGTPDGWAPPRTSGWVEARTEHFTVRSQAGGASARRLALDLERFRLALSGVTGGLALAHPVPTSIVPFESQRALHPYLLDRDGKPLHAGGVTQPGPFENRIWPDASAAGPPRIAYHEYVHAVLADTLGWLPVWLDEGLAEYFSTFQSQRGGRRVEVGHPIEQHVATLRGRPRLPWPEVLEATHEYEAYHDESRQPEFYAQAWLGVHYLMSTDDGIRRLGRYLSALREGRAPERAWAEGLGFDRATFIAGVEDYARAGSGHVSWTFGEEARAAEAAVVLRELDAAEVLYALGDLVAHVGPRENAERHLELARGAGWPVEDVEAALGAAAAAAGDDDALPHLEAAVRGGTKSPEAQ